MFRLWAWDSLSEDQAPSFATDVIVGRALNTQTPVFDEELSYLIFRPQWDVPCALRGTSTVATRLSIMRWLPG